MADISPHHPSTATMTPTMVRVLATRRDLADTVTVDLTPHGGPTPEPGQFHMLWVPGVGEVPISVSGVETDGRIRHTIRAVGAVSRALAALETGDEVGVRGPFGQGWDLNDLAGRDLLIVAGGLGLAPLRPVVVAAARGDLDTRTVRLVAGARSPDALLYAEDLAGRWANLDVRTTVDTAFRADGEEAWSGPIGPVTPLLDDAVADARQTTALVCGPEIMMAVVARALASIGVPSDRIQISLERNMQCGHGHCGHCQLGSRLLCLTGPVVTWTAGEALLEVRER